jgi:hypothetical protein
VICKSIQQCEWINPFSQEPDGKMQMRTGRAAGAANFTEDIPGQDFMAFLNQDLGKMGIE